MQDTRNPSLPRARSHQSVNVLCVVCKFPVRWLPEAYRVIRDDGTRLWVCKACWDTPVENVFSGVV